MKLQETFGQAEVIDPEFKVRLEKEAMKDDHKRAQEIWEIADLHQIPRDMVNQAI